MTEKDQKRRKTRCDKIAEEELKARKKERNHKYYLANKERLNRLRYEKQKAQMMGAVIEA